MTPPPKSSLVRASFLAFAYLITPIVTEAVEGQSVATIVAAQIRSQGFSCADPTSAQRIAADSAPNHTVYILTCQAATYRVVLVPDQAALVAEMK
jgi:hypothetical protein